MARLFHHLNTSWIPCGDTFKEVYEEQWIQEAHASGYSDQESQYRWEDSSSLKWRIHVSRPLNHWNTTLAMRAKAAAGRIGLQVMRIPPVYLYPWTTAGTLDVKYQLLQAVFHATNRLVNHLKRRVRPRDPGFFKNLFLNKPTEPQEGTPPLTPCVHESTHSVQFGIMPKRLPLPHPDDEKLSGFVEDVSFGSR